MRIRNKLYHFMQGRYGLDTLGKATFWLYFLVFILSLFLGGNLIFDIVMLFLIFVMYYRFLSKDIYKRTKENNKYLAFLKRIKTSPQKKDSVYKNCHHCHKKLKLPIPSKRGIKHVQCPKCHKRNTFLIMHKLKVEVIKRKERNK